MCLLTFAFVGGIATGITVGCTSFGLIKHLWPSRMCVILQAADYSQANVVKEFERFEAIKAVKGAAIEPGLQTFGNMIKPALLEVLASTKKEQLANIDQAESS